VANSAPSSIKIHRLDIAGLLPRSGVKWWGQNASAEARCDIAVPGHVEPGRIWFKSVDQGHRAFKGDQVRFVAISEEPEGDEGRLVLDECMRACSSTGGRVVLEMTPQNGLTWVHDDLIEAGKYDARLIELDSSHNVLVPDYASLQRWLASLPEEERRMRQFGQFVDRRGLVYTGWARGDGERMGMGHVCDAFLIPPEWPRFRGVDFGLVNPTCCLWGALGDDDTLYIYREHYESGPTYAEHCHKILELERGEVIEAGWGDPAAAETIRDWAQQDLYLALANNDVNTGIDAVKDRLRYRSDQRPRLKVFRECRNLIREFEGYVWDPRRRDSAPVKKADHALDALRYLVMGVREWGSI
jgi:TusA-related sulfurtransferase